MAGPALLEPQPTTKFSDVPVPVGFKFIPAESYAFESLGVRVGVLKYRGKTDPDRVINFYKEQMPMYSWNTLNIIEFGERMLNFERDNETCIINLISRGSTVDAIITVGPKAQQSAKRNTKPVK